jgi:hypothetical protein
MEFRARKEKRRGSEKKQEKTRENRIKQEKIRKKQGESISECGV